ncbi:MAG: UDP-N-acetylmuramoyl-L-alanine--D-glutamate ligase [Schleiferiaceae bacterium]|nr:UDP-N-acetylmuramoyl-L-alanine--D-glutamate ligase [Schleiferiaceae bacterium]
MDLKGQHIVILGAGESGVGAAFLAMQLGATVLVSDNGAISPKYLEKLSVLDIPFEQGGHSKDLVLAADIVIKSPGIPETISLLQERKALGKDWIGEIEFAWQFTKANIIAVTGTNGKTTTTSIIYEMLKHDGKRVGLGGNIGQSFAWQVATAEFDWYVLELSSFQLDNIQSFRPHIAVLTNITPDHLDRYNYNLEAYIAAKFRITKNQQAEDYLIYCEDDALTQKALAERLNDIQAQLIPFGVSSAAPQGASFNEQQQITIRLKEEEAMTIEELALQGRHNAYNSMAAGIASRLAGVRKESIREILSAYEGVEHRLEFVREVTGIRFINDSKATNVNSTMYALESVKTPIVWIAGGVDKGNDYMQIEDLVAGKVKALVCLGVDNQKLIEEFGECVDAIMEVNTMDEAVRTAFAIARAGDTVLLSPACASFDLFQDYQDRGNQFKHFVQEL